MLNSFADKIIKDSWFQTLKIGFEAEFIFPTYQLVSSKRSLEDINKLSYHEQRKLMAKQLACYITDRRISISEEYHSNEKKTDILLGQIFDHLEPDLSISNKASSDIFFNFTPASIYTNTQWVDCEFSSRTYSQLAENENPFKDFFEGVQTLFSFLAHTKCLTNSSTGFHITLSGFPFNFSWETLILKNSTQCILSRFRRKYNEYTFSHLKQIIWDMNESDRKLLLSSSTINVAAILNKNLSYNIKNLDVHLKDKSQNIIELRAMGNAMYHLKFDAICRSLYIFLNAIKQECIRPASTTLIRKKAVKAILTHDSQTNLEKIQISKSAHFFEEESRKQTFSGIIKYPEVIATLFFSNQETMMNIKKILNIATLRKEILYSEFLQCLAKDAKKFTPQNYKEWGREFVFNRIYNLNIDSLTLFDFLYLEAYSSYGGPFFYVGENLFSVHRDYNQQSHWSLNLKIIDLIQKLNRAIHENRKVRQSFDVDINKRFFVSLKGIIELFNLITALIDENNSFISDRFSKGDYSTFFDFLTAIECAIGDDDLLIEYLRQYKTSCYDERMLRDKIKVVLWVNEKLQKTNYNIVQRASSLDIENAIISVSRIEKICKQLERVSYEK